MLRGSSALVSVFLCSVCLVVVLTRSPAPSKKRPCSKDIIIKVTSLKKSLLNQTLVNCTLYTPTIEDYKKCPSAAFKCFADEMIVLSEELKISGLTYDLALSLNRMLKRLAQSFKQPESDCHQCELHKEESADGLLEALQEVLWLMNSEFCQEHRT
ncbi:interleukin 15, like isoform X2 [Girardinichthys multiradiatus]|uniref:interleukin 15, like isoform X2 n=1 Tax=Girardinichthys multiradiatus TaxID=208333 RepID=UPI001FACC1D6|nr:interleukin 15, like isoform X2 [Girardinichthys multiradiatus]